MEVRQLAIPGTYEITPKRIGDDRGYFAETFRDDIFRKKVQDIDFVQENQSFSSAPGTIRGLHFQSKPFEQGKLVRCLQGAIFDVAVDIRHSSPHYGQSVAVELRDDALNQIWIPPGFAHGFCTLVPNCIVSYKVTAYYSRDNDHNFAWNDGSVGINWPAAADENTLSTKDAGAPILSELPNYFEFEG